MNGCESTNIIQWLRRRGAEQGDDAAFHFLANGQEVRDRLTYADLDRRSREIGVMLQRLLEPGDRALLVYPPGLDFATAFFGCLYAGVIAVPAYPPSAARPERAARRLSVIARESQAGALLCSEDLVLKYDPVFRETPGLSQLPLLPTDHYGLESVDSLRPVDLRSDDVAFLQYTSGSTAAPKGVMVTHGNILHNLSYICEASNRGDAPVVVSWLPTYHDMGLFSGILYPLYRGCPSYLMAPVSFLQKPVRWLQAISTFRGSVSGGPP